jgi:hypothetical protein
MLFVIKITLFYACLYKYSIRMIFANPDGDSHEPSESSCAPPSCAKIDLRSSSGRVARTLENLADLRGLRRDLLTNTACGSRS